MASILDRYGIKEVADVTFYDIDPATGEPGKPVLYLDTLKVSTIEQTSETSDARGGKGNPKLISWDYGKEINVTLEDALFSAKSLSIMFGNGTVAHDNKSIVRRTTVARYNAAGSYFMADVYENGGAVRKKIWLVENAQAIPDGQEGVCLSESGVKIVRFTDEDGTREQTYTKATYTDWTSFVAGTTGDKVVEGQKVFITYELSASTSTILVSADSFPGTYYITGDTYARSDVTGKDQFFQFIIPKAKVTSENTITLEAEGDPSVFNMSLTVLRPDSGEMMKLVQYELTAG
jgi:hypothetical protein